MKEDGGVGNSGQVGAEMKGTEMRGSGLASASAANTEENLLVQIQSTLLRCPPPLVDGVEVYGASIPFQMLGGDYYDFLITPAGHLRIVIGDVMGKGIAAALLMVMTRTAVRMASASPGSPGEMLTTVNRYLYHDLQSLKSFVTLFCADYYPGTGLLTFANAGHHFPLLFSENQEPRELQARGVMIGAMRNRIYAQQSVLLGKGDLVLFFTDGMFEVKNRQGQQLGVRGLRSIVDQYKREPLVKLVEKTLREVSGYGQGSRLGDDMTLAVLRKG